jgi:uncharacterized protein DUF3800
MRRDHEQTLFGRYSDHLFAPRDITLTASKLTHAAPKNANVWGTRHPARRESRFVVLKAYLDETGIVTNDPYCVIAGYVGNVEEWAKVESKWKFVLEEFKVPYFHALEFYKDDKKNFYKGWKESKRSAFINFLFDCLRDHQVWLLSSAVDVQTFLSLTEDERRYMTGGIHNGLKWVAMGAPTKSYFVPFHEIILQAASHVPDTDKVWMVMSRQDQYENKALEIYDMMLASDPPLRCRSRLGDDMVFSDPKLVCQLQAADLAAWWSGKAMRYRAKVRTDDLKEFKNRVELKRVLERMRSWDDLKLFNLQGLILLLQGTPRYLTSSFPTLDQQLPSLPIQKRKEILSDMRKVSLRKFVDQWQPNAQERRD